MWSLNLQDGLDGGILPLILSLTQQLRLSQLFVEQSFLVIDWRCTTAITGPRRETLQLKTPGFAAPVHCIVLPISLSAHPAELLVDWNWRGRAPITFKDFRPGEIASNNIVPAFCDRQVIGLSGVTSKVDRHRSVLVFLGGY